MIPDYEFLDTLQKMQIFMAGTTIVAPKFNYEALNKLAEHDRTVLKKAVEVVQCHEEHDEKTAKESIKLILAFSRLAVKLQFDSDMTNLWLKNLGVEAGVTKEGKIAFWAKGNPSSIETIFEG
jgi:hypothetical protein